MNHARYLRLPSRHLGRRVHLWQYGWYGTPVLAFPTAAGMAHDWQVSGAIEALDPLLRAGLIKIYQPETNVSETWTAEGDPITRLRRHEAYEAFILDELVPHIREDCRSPELRILTAGASLGALYAANMALKHPETFEWALCLSGRYSLEKFVPGIQDEGAYFNNPLAYVPNLSGASLERVRRQTALTLVVGLGPFEGGCLDETLAMADALHHRGIPHERDVWGKDVSHHWDWWKRQLRYHLTRRVL